MIFSSHLIRSVTFHCFVAYKDWAQDFSSFCVYYKLYLTFARKYIFKACKRKTDVDVDDQLSFLLSIFFRNF